MSLSTSLHAIIAQDSHLYTMKLQCTWNENFPLFRCVYYTLIHPSSHVCLWKSLLHSFLSCITLPLQLLTTLHALDCFSSMISPFISSSPHSSFMQYIYFSIHRNFVIDITQTNISSGFLCLKECIVFCYRILSCCCHLGYDTV